MSGPIGNNPYRASGVVAAAAAGREGTVDWDTSIHTSTVTAESGTGYFVNTTGGAVTVNLPAATVGDIVGIKDYAGTFDTYACTVAPNGSEKIGGGSDVDPTLTVEGESVLLVYADATQGWLATQQSVTSSPSGNETFITATGGTPCTGAIVCTNYKVHSFTGPGTFCVSVAASCAANNAVAYMVVASGGGGGGSPTTNTGAPGGAGGFREGTTAPIVPYTASPLVAPAGITVTASPYTITVGAAGAGSPTALGTVGNVSTFSTITAAGGGRGGTGNPPPCVPARTGGDGGSGGGAGGGGTCFLGGTGNVPCVSPPQGNDGGTSRTDPGADSSSGGAGGAGGAGGKAGPGGTPCLKGGAGGAHVNSTITGTDTEYAGGAGGAGLPGAAGTPGGGGAANAKSPTAEATNASDNTGGSGGGTYDGSPASNGGSGVVVIRYKFQ